MPNNRSTNTPVLLSNYLILIGLSKAAPISKLFPVEAGADKPLKTNPWHRQIRNRAFIKGYRYQQGTNYLYMYTFLAFLVKETSGILIFGPSFRKPARKASSGEIYLKNKDLYATDL